MHGQYLQRIKEADVDFKQTNNWLKGTGLKAETEGLIIAAQDQTLATRLYHYKIIKDGTSPLFLLCNQYDDSIDHILSGCPELAKTEYRKRPCISRTFFLKIEAKNRGCGLSMDTSVFGVRKNLINIHKTS